MNETNPALPPHSLDAEMAVLGSMLVEREAIIKASELLRAEDFYAEKHRVIFEAIQSLDARGNAIDFVTVSESLKDVPAFLGSSAREVVIELTEKVPTALHVEHYAKIVQEKATLRKLIDRARSVSREASTSSKSAEELVGNAQEAFFSISLEQTKRESFTSSQLMHSAVEMVEMLMKEKKAVTGIATGFDRFDAMTSGFQKGQLVIIAGRPGMGKTSLVMNFAEGIAIDHKQAVVFFSLEMSSMELSLRLLCSRAQLDMGRVRTGYLGRESWPKITSVAADIADAPLTFDFATSPTVVEVRSAARRYAYECTRRGEKLSCIIIDYLQLMRGGDKSESRQQEIAEISRSLKGLARELEVPVIALSQLNRKSDEREGGRPQLSDLRESGAIEQDADIVMAIWRDLKAELPEDKAKAQLIILKQRNGPIGDIPLTFLGHSTRFVERTDEVEPAGV